MIKSFPRPGLRFDLCRCFEPGAHLVYGEAPLAPVRDVVNMNHAQGIVGVGVQTGLLLSPPNPFGFFDRGKNSSHPVGICEISIGVRQREGWLLPTWPKTLCRYRLLGSCTPCTAATYIRLCSLMLSKTKRKDLGTCGETDHGAPRSPPHRSNGK